LYYSIPFFTFIVPCQLKPNKMMLRISHISVFLLLVVFCYNATAQKKTNTDSLALFKEVKEKYGAYEKKHGHYIQTPNVKMHYLKWENPGGVPLIWMHGTYSNAYELMAFSDELIAMGFEVYSIDYYAHGQTPVPEKEVSHYHIADDVLFLMNAEGIDKAVIGGWSRGGFISSMFYDQYPDRTLGLILEDGGFDNFIVSYNNADSEERNTFFEQMRNFEDPTEKLFDSLREAWDYYNKTIYTWYSFHSDFIKVDEKFLWGINALRTVNNADWGINPGLANLVKARKEDVAEMDKYFKNPTIAPLFFREIYSFDVEILFRHLHVPTLIFDPRQEKEDFLSDVGDQAEMLARRHPKYIIHKIYKDTHHEVKFQRPEQFLNDVEEFSERIKAHYEEHENISKSIAERLIEGLNIRDAKIYEKLCADNYTSFFPSNSKIAMTKEQELRNAQGAWKAFPDLKWIISDMITDGNKVAVSFTITGTHQEDWGGIPAKGNVINIGGLMTLEIEEEKIVRKYEEMNVEDLFGQMQQ